MGVVELTLITMKPRGLWDVSTRQRNRDGRIFEPCVWLPMSTLSGRVWTLYLFNTIVFPVSCLGPALQSTGVQGRVLHRAWPSRVSWSFVVDPALHSREAFPYHIPEDPLTTVLAAGRILLVGALQSNADLPLEVSETRQAGMTVYLGPGLLGSPANASC